MIKPYLKFALLVVFVIWISIKFSGIYSVYGIKPDILLIILIRHSLHDPRPQLSIAWGFFSGLARDIVIGDVVGISSLVYSIVCFSVSYFKRDSIFTPSHKRTLVYVYSIVFSIFLAYTVTHSGMPFFRNIAYIIIPSSIYTMAAALIFQTLKPTR
jgi:rod shape-determining protein MreD